jgi:hypothetical protein
VIPEGAFDDLENEIIPELKVTTTQTGMPDSSSLFLW